MSDFEIERVFANSSVSTEQKEHLVADKLPSICIEIIPGNIGKLFQHINRNDYISFVQMLRDHPELVNQKDSVYNLTPLYVSCLIKNRDEFTNVLLEKGADINAESYLNFTVCDLLVRMGNRDKLETFLKTGKCDVDKVMIDGFNLLKRAVFAKNVDIVALLLEHGMNEELKKDAIFFALYHDAQNILDLFLERIEIKDLDSIFYDDLSPLLFATWHGSVNSVEKLLKKGISTQVFDEQCKDNIVLLAAKKKDVEMIKFLLEYKDQYGFDIHAIDNQGNNALLIATYFNIPEMVELLLKYDVNLYQKNFIEKKCALDLVPQVAQKLSKGKSLYSVYKAYFEKKLKKVTHQLEYISDKEFMTRERIVEHQEEGYRNILATIMRINDRYKNCKKDIQYCIREEADGRLDIVYKQAEGFMQLKDQERGDMIKIFNYQYQSLVQMVRDYASQLKGLQESIGDMLPEIAR